MPYKDPENERNREARRMTVRKWASKNRPKINARAKRYRERHPERVKASFTTWLENHPEAMPAAQRRYRQANADKVNAKNQTQRARRINAPVNDFTAQQWIAMKEAYQHRCAYCGKKQRRLTQDHIQPLSKGGSHTYSNIVPACKSCNSKKGAGAVLKPIQPLLLIA
jgi:5-methylcytosine-specific restriction endonuclease McrA